MKELFLNLLIRVPEALSHKYVNTAIVVITSSIPIIPSTQTGGAQKKEELNKK